MATPIVSFESYEVQDFRCGQTGTVRVRVMPNSEQATVRLCLDAYPTCSFQPGNQECLTQMVNSDTPWNYTTVTFEVEIGCQGAFNGASPLSVTASNADGTSDPDQKTITIQCP